MRLVVDSDETFLSNLANISPSGEISDTEEELDGLRQILLLETVEKTAKMVAIIIREFFIVTS